MIEGCPRNRTPFTNRSWLPMLLCGLALAACGDDSRPVTDAGPGSDSAMPVGPRSTIREVCSDIAEAACQSASRCDELTGTLVDCLTTATFDCCSSFDNCELSVPIATDAREACTASIRSQSCSDTEWSNACATVIDQLQNPPLDAPTPDGWSASLCSEIGSRQIRACRGYTADCLPRSITDLASECSAEHGAYARCFVNTNSCSPCFAELEALLTCQADYCECTDSECTGVDPRCPEPAPKLYFVSRDLELDEFGASVAGADSHCQTEALNAGLSGNWRAFFSSPTEPIASRFPTSRDYETVTGAAGFNLTRTGTEVALTRMGPNLVYDARGARSSGINREQDGRNYALAWSGIGGDCQGWTSESPAESHLLLDLASDSPTAGGVRETCETTAYLRSIINLHMLCLEQ